LIGRNRDLRPQLDYPVTALDYLDLGARDVQAVAQPQVGRKADHATLLHRHIGL
jgi:hypothetical protein